jgi:adenosylmethionine-8-amino-7-oxononanoate aminotransferase
MKDYETFPPLHIVRAEGSFLFTADGDKIIDAISSWWCKTLGHTHPEIKEAVNAQISKFEHVIMANTCNDTLVELSERITGLIQGLDKIFYADNGSTAVEIALKMSLQYNLQTGRPSKKKFLSLQNGYHGETTLTLAAGDCELYSAPYAALMPSVKKIDKIPYIYQIKNSEDDILTDAEWEEIEKQINSMKDELSGIIFEPVLQGAGGMLIYKPDFLTRLRKWANKNEVHLIADEIMTGFGRTGKMFACDYAKITPDFMCISKGLTAGWGPMAAVLTSNKIYNAFYDDYFSGKAFMHSNTYCGYPITAAAALAALNIYERDNIIESVAQKSSQLRKRMEDIAKNSNALTNIRSIGYMTAADIINPDTGKPFPKKERTGYKCYKQAVKNGILLRPLGDTIYFLPPLNTENKVLDELADKTLKTINEIIF